MTLSATLRKAVEVRMRLALVVLCSIAWITAPAAGQRLNGTIRLQAMDSTGAALEASGTLKSLSAGVNRRFQTNAQGFHTFGSLPFGLYRLEIERAGFASQAVLIEVRSETPLDQT